MKHSQKLTVRLDLEADADILVWIRMVRQQGYGALGREVKAALRAWIAEDGTTSSSSFAASDPMNLDALLPALRQVVEAALASALAGVTLSASSPTPENDDEAMVLLERLGADLLLKDVED